MQAGRITKCLSDRKRAHWTIEKVANSKDMLKMVHEGGACLVRLKAKRTAPFQEWILA
ncbi:MAG: hypothetical protein AAGC57_20085 [Pseudomonadota bacterium]